MRYLGIYQMEKIDQTGNCHPSVAFPAAIFPHRHPHPLTLTLLRDSHLFHPFLPISATSPPRQHLLLATSCSTIITTPCRCHCSSGHVFFLGRSVVSGGIVVSIRARARSTAGLGSKPKVFQFSWSGIARNQSTELPVKLGELTGPSLLHGMT